MSGSTTAVPAIDLNLLTSRLAHVASSLQGVAQDAATLAKTPQAAFAEAPPWAVQLIATTDELLDDNRRLRKDNQDLKNGLAQTFRRLDGIPSWATRLFDENRELLEENRRLGQTCSHILSGHDQLMARSGDVSATVTRLERDMKRVLDLQMAHEDVFSSPLSPRTKLNKLKRSSTPVCRDDGKQLSTYASSTIDCKSPRSRNGSIWPASEIDTPSNFFLGEDDRDKNLDRTFESLEARQWEPARAKNRQVKGTKADPFIPLEFPPGVLALAFPKSYTRVGKQTTQQLQALLEAYNQPFSGKNHDELLADFKRFIGLEDLQTCPPGSIWPASGINTPSNLFLGGNGRDENLHCAIESLEARQWEPARAKNRQVKGTKGDPFITLEFPPGVPVLSFPRTYTKVRKLTSQKLQALLEAYNQPFLGKDHDELLADFKRFIGLEALQTCPPGSSTNEVPLTNNINDLSPAIKQQWEVARSVNRNAKGGSLDKFQNLVFPPGTKSGLSAPRTLEGIERMDAAHLQLILTAYQQPIGNKSRLELLTDYKRFIGFEQ